MDNIMQTVQVEMDRAVERQQRARASLQANLASLTTNLVSVRNSMALGTKPLVTSGRWCVGIVLFFTSSGQFVRQLLQVPGQLRQLLTRSRPVTSAFG